MGERCFKVPDTLSGLKFLDRERTRKPRLVGGEIHSYNTLPEAYRFFHKKSENEKYGIERAKEGCRINFTC
jgi:hypothetical protein